MMILLGKEERENDRECTIRLDWPAMYTILNKERGRVCHNKEGFKLCPVALSCLAGRQERERASAQVCILNGDTQQVSTTWHYDEDLRCGSSMHGHNEDNPQQVDTTSICIVSTQQVHACRLVCGGPFWVGR
jgi:hypothetical protein